MEDGRVILENEHFQLTLERLCHQLVENYENFNDACIIGIQMRGAMFADRIHKLLAEITGIDNIPYGKLDITFYRDDFRQRDKPLRASTTEIDFLVEEKRVILIDDVLYTGRTVQAAMTALNHYGRPASVELMSLIDRRFNRHLPIRSNYTGMVVDALDEAYVRVDWEYNKNKQHRVLIFSAKE